MNIDTAGEILGLIHQYGGIHELHHKQWLLDQIVRKLTADFYQDWVTDFNNDGDGTPEDNWNEGVAP
jgi:hypothetical protein